MTEVNLVTEGLKLMAVGMTVVFLFLMLLIASMEGLAVVVGWFSPPRDGERTFADTASLRKKAAAAAAVIHHFKKAGR